MRPRTLLVFGRERGSLRNIYASGGRGFLHDILEVAGGVNVFADINAESVQASSEQILLTIPHPTYGNHNGGQLVFGPDGYLYAGTGDGGGGGDPFANAQNPTALLGKLLRLDVDVESPPFYAAPPDNPFVAPGDPGRDEIWAYGLRNPWRFSFDRGTGDLYIGDVGQGEVEEVDYTPRASPGLENYGWDVYEGSSRFEEKGAGPGELVFPIYEYTHDRGCTT